MWCCLYPIEPGFDIVHARFSPGESELRGGWQAVNLWLTGAPVLIMRRISFCLESSWNAGSVPPDPCDSTDLYSPAAYSISIPVYIILTEPTIYY